jgi:oligopeptide/dipeptide ABC transporter ATP-binding protein
MSGESHPVLRVSSVGVRLHGARRATRVAGGHRILNDVSLEVAEGQILGVIGETGSGKTTLARTVMGLVRPVEGKIFLDGREISGLRGRALRTLRRRGEMQMIFQDPLRSLDPDLTVGQLVAEGLVITRQSDRQQRTDAVTRALQLVGLPPAITSRRPGQISGGQRQRVAIARALVLEPRLLLCDEPVSALDASTRNYILEILGRLRDELRLAMIVISHDLTSLTGIADRVAVLYRGRIVEAGPTEEVFSSPRHPYTALLIASAPRVSRARWSFDIPAQELRPVATGDDGPATQGCVFADRCRFAADDCRAAEPQPTEAAPEWQVSCYHPAAWLQHPPLRPEVAVS